MPIPILPTGGGSAGGGEANTASSQGSGTSIYYQKSGVDLQFNAIKSENNLLTVALDGVSHDVELTINEANFVLDGVTAQIDGINSNGGNFNFKTTGTHNIYPDGSSTKGFSFWLGGGDDVVLQVIGSPANFRLECGGNVKFEASGDSDNYIQFSTTSNIPKLDFVGGNNGLITNLADPTSAQDAATKNYVDTGGAGRDTTAIHDNVAAEISAITEKSSPAGADWLVIEDSADSNNKKKVQVGNLPTGGGGEANTASSQGSGTSIYYQKSGIDLQFNAIKSENSLLTVSLDSGTHDIELTVNESSFILDGVTAQIDAINSDGGTFNFDTSGVLNLRPSGDTTYYLEVSTLTGIPTFTVKGGSTCQIKTDTTQTTLSIDNTCNLNLNAYSGYTSIFSNGAFRITGNNTIDIRPSSDSSYYVEFSTTSNIPKIDFVGGNNGLITNLADPTNAQDAATKNYVDTATPAAHTHDGDTLQLDAINSDGGTFNFDTSGTLNIRPSGQTSYLCQFNNSSSYIYFKTIGTLLQQCTSNINFLPNGNNGNYIQMSTTSSIPKIDFVGGNNGLITNLADPTNAQDAATKNYVDTATPAAHTHDGDTLQFDAINSNGGEFFFDTSGQITFRSAGNTSQNVSFNNVSTTNYFTSSCDILYTTPISHSINIAPGGDFNNYVQFTTTSNVPKIDFVGGTNGLITNLADPTNAQDAATKNYVDNMTWTESDITDLDHTDSDAIHDDTASEIYSITEKGTPVSADVLIIEDSADSYNKKRVQIGNLPGGGGGEANTASSQGSGTSIYYQKSGVDLQFNAIKSENGLLTVSLDSGTHDVELTVNESSIDHDNLTNTHNLTTDIDHDQLTNFTSDEHFTQAAISITESQISDLDHDDTDAIHDNVSGEIVAVTEKTTLVANDEFLIEDSAASNAKKSAKISAIRITESQITDLGSYLENVSEDSSPQLGGDMDFNDHGGAINTDLTANSTYEGLFLELTVSGLTFGQCVYVSGNNAGSLADADAVGTMPAVGIYVGTNKVLTHGVARYDSWSWTAGQRLYVGTDGNLTSTAPSGTGDYVQVMGIAVNATAVMIMPSLTEVVHT